MITLPSKCIPPRIIKLLPDNQCNFDINAGRLIKKPRRRIERHGRVQKGVRKMKTAENNEISADSHATSRDPHRREIVQFEVTCSR